MVHWLGTAISTYCLHPLHGNGYQWWSGLGGRTLGVATILAVIKVHLHHNHKR